MMKLMATTAILVSLAVPAAWAEEGQAAQPYELTSRGVIAQAAREAYKEAIETCPGTEPGSAPQGPKFVVCLK